MLVHTCFWCLSPFSPRVLLRFCREAVAVIADIEQMFHSFVVSEDNQNLLCFLWFKENDPSQEIVEYWVKVHVFGNSPSPAVVTYRLHRAAEHGANEYGMDDKHFVEHNFYVDDGLTRSHQPQKPLTC